MTFADCLIDFPPRRPPLLASQFAYDLVLTGCFPLLISFFVFRFELYLQHLTNRLRSVFLFLQKFRLFFFFFSCGAVHEPWSQRRWSGLSSRRRDFHHYCYHDNYHHNRHPQSFEPAAPLFSSSSLPPSFASLNGSLLVAILTSPSRIPWAVDLVAPLVIFAPLLPIPQCLEGAQSEVPL